MKSKVIIVAVCILLLWCVVFGYNKYTEAFQDLETVINTVSSLGQTVINANGLDFDERLEYFLPELNDISFGSYYDEETNEISLVGKKIKSYLPMWLSTSSYDGIDVSVYPTLYSVDFCYQSSVFDIGSPPGTFGNSLFRNYKAFGKKYCIRLLISISNYYDRTVINSYRSDNKFDVFVFYHEGELKYFVSVLGSSSGLYSDYLNSMNDYLYTEDVAEKLNGKYSQRLVDFNDTIFKRYIYSYTDRVQDTGLYISSSFTDFLKGE